MRCFRTHLFELLVACAVCLAGNAPGAEVADGTLLQEWKSGFIEVPGASFRAHRFETVQNIYRSLMGQNPSRWPGDDHSVEMVTWDEAVTFCRKATERMRGAKLIGADDEVRLPTEREWEIICRAGTTTAYSFGEEAQTLGEYCWYEGNAAGNDPPAGAKKPNPWGFYDVHGYVWEWCADLVGEERVVRGGAWTSKPEECRSDSRQVVNREARVPDIGFRCVLAKAGS
jgi:formylglycine-generating enzyme required for sulfatase activity